MLREQLFLQIRELDPQALTQADTPIAWILRALQTVEEPKEEWKRVQELVVRQLDALPKAEQAQWRRAMQYLYMLVRHKRDAVQQDELSETIRQWRRRASVRASSRARWAVPSIGSSHAAIAAARLEGRVCFRRANTRRASM